MLPVDVARQTHISLYISNGLYASLRVSSGLHGGDRHDMGDCNDRRQPLHHRVYRVSMVHPLDGEDTAGCRASLSSCVQHPELWQEARRTHQYNVPGNN